MEVGSNISLFFKIFGLARKSELLDKIMIFGAEYLIFATFILAVFFALRGGAREKKALILTVIAIAAAEVIIFLAHLIYYEPRPYLTYQLIPLIKHTPDAAFPSGHTTIMMTIAWSFVFYKSKFGPLILLLALWVGFARIFVGVHYPFDIVGGIITGLIGAGGAWLIKNRLFKLLF